MSINGSAAVDCRQQTMDLLLLGPYRVATTIGGLLGDCNWWFYAQMWWCATTVHLSCHACCRYVCDEREVACRQQMAEVLGRICLLNRWQVGFYTSDVGCLYQWINWMHWFALLLSCNWRWADDEGQRRGFSCVSSCIQSMRVNFS